MAATTNGQNSYRDTNGRFLDGAPAGPGNPYSRAVNNFRRVLYECITQEDFQAVVRALLDAAKAGQSWAVKEVLDRLLGKPVTGVIAMQVEKEPASQADWWDNLDEEEQQQLALLLSMALQPRR